MAIHPQLLEKARLAGSGLSDAERRVREARTEYHAIVRRMHLAGGSLREIAEALGLSHQRIQQMVQGAGGSWWQRVWRSRNVRRGLTCTFCNRTQDQVASLIAGPKVYICEACAAHAERSLTSPHPAAAPGLPAFRRENAKVRCSFCGKHGAAGRTVLIAPGANICAECLSICGQILTDRGGGDG
ncbi:MAG: hypothetical protein H6Q05_1104 [Acidobacteria bacterium]|jgi:hypothetical protein|nr:hypothetical protein [Acidobacteriota bacterium]